LLLAIQIEAIYTNAEPQQRLAKSNDRNEQIIINPVAHQ